MHVLFTVGREPTMYNKNGNSYFQFSIKNVRKFLFILFPTHEVWLFVNSFNPQE